MQNIAELYKKSNEKPTSSSSFLLRWHWLYL